MSRVTLLIVSLICSLSLPAEARPRRGQTRDVGERVADGFGYGLSTSLAGAAGGVLSAMLVTSGCRDTMQDEYASNDCFYTGLFGFLVGSTVGAFLGGPIFDGVSDGDGSVWGGTAGMVLGGAAGVGLGIAMEDGAVAFFGGASLMAVGAGLGYALFDDASVRPTVMYQADAAGGVMKGFGLTGRF